LAIAQRLVGCTLRSLTPVGVIQEVYGVLLAHYAAPVLIHAAALAVDSDTDQLGFAHALEIVRDAVPEFQQVAPAPEEVSGCRGHPTAASCGYAARGV
jgi:hypothetical protein